MLLQTIEGIICFCNFIFNFQMGNPCYKAPELLMGSTNYSTAIDIWSMGCIFAEMSRLQPLFIGKDEPEILAEIFW